MVQSVLFFVLGFLCAGFLALMVAPAIWRRAVALTRRRIEASVPLTLSEIQADKDRMRAEFAMSTRRLEMSVKSLREKTAEQLVEINRGREELKDIAADRAEKNQAISELEARSGELRAELRQREDQLQLQSQRLAETEQTMEKRALELGRLERMYDEASFSSSNRQIELVARESELEKLSSDVSRLRGQRKQADQHNQEMAAEMKTVSDALKQEEKKTAELDKKLERLFATLADREEKLDRREKELAGLRERLKGTAKAENALNAQLIKVQSGRLKVEDEHADLASQKSALLSGAKGGEKAMTTPDADREQLEARMRILERENDKLKNDLAAFGTAKSDGWSDERRQDAMLREQMNGLAAEVVHLTAMLDGPDSLIAKALAMPHEAQGGERLTSLADRVRALQKAASAN